MARRRKFRTLESRIESAVRPRVEALEPRQLLTTITGSGILEYKDGSDGPVRVVWENLTAELVFINVLDDAQGTRPAGDFYLADHIPRSDEDTPGRDLFHIYIAESSIDSKLAIARIDETTNQMVPLEGNLQFSVFDTGGELIDVNSGPGDILLGGLTAGDKQIPIMQDSFFGLGILGPRPRGKLAAGVFVEQGQDFGRFLFGGTIFGSVYFGSSVDTFYAGTLPTGLSTGEFEGQLSIPSNFFVAGDLRDLITTGPIGTAVAGEGSYDSGFDLEVGGSVGQIHNLLSDINGSATVFNSPAASRIRSRQREIESRITSPAWFQLFALANGPFTNDSFELAQFVGTFYSRDLGQNAIQISGRLDPVPIGDTVDFYAVGLMAGQTITIRLLAPSGLTDPLTERETSRANIEIYDPDNRMVASDYGATQFRSVERMNEWFQFTAKRPGAHRFAVRRELPGGVNYQLQILGAGESTAGGIHHANGVPLGGLVAGGTINDPRGLFFFDTRRGFRVRRGDFGALEAAAFFTSSSDQTIFVEDGNLRAASAASIGVIGEAAEGEGTTFGAGLDLHVPKGSVGLLRNTDPAAVLALNFVADQAMGGDYQVIDAAGLFGGQVIANRAIGTVRAGRMNTIFPNAFAANDDNIGNDGVIDLIDVTGDFGILGGGPQLSAGDEGNIRYIRIGGIAFRDVLFGGGQPEETTFEPGESASFVDDSGTLLGFTPIPIEREFDFATGQNVLIDPGELTIVTLPVRRNRTNVGGGGGSVILSVESTRGLQVGSSAGFPNGTAEIGLITASGTGTAIINDTNLTPLDLTDDFLRFAALGDPLQVLIDGNARVDVLEINGEGGPATFTEISNGTSGEIVSVDAVSIGSLRARTLGLTRSHTGAEVAPIDAFNNTSANADFPWMQQTYGISVSGDVIDVASRHGLGNILVGGIVQNVVANADGRYTSGVFEGINAPVYSVGDMRFVNIGEGILPSGTAEFSDAGLYSDGVIVRVINQGLGSDIRGDIVAIQGIGSVELINGSIINADILMITDLADSAENAGLRAIQNLPDPITNPIFDVGNISLNGVGGIIGAFVLADDLGTVVVENGFGIFNSVFGVLGDGVFNHIAADGYGMRSLVLRGGATARGIHARGNGTRVSTLSYTPSVRISESFAFDPYFGTVPNRVTDLHVYLGTSAAVPKRKGISNTGSIEDSSLVASRDLVDLTAQTIKRSLVNFGNSIHSMIVRDYTDGLAITTGRLDGVIVMSDVFRSDWTVSGPVGVVDVRGTFRGSSALRASGSNGSIDVFKTGRSLFGTVTSTLDINNLIVGTHLGSPGFGNFAGIDVGRDLKNFTVNGSVLETATVQVDDDIFNLNIGGDVLEGAVIRADDILAQIIKGQVFGDIIIT